MAYDPQDLRNQWWRSGKLVALVSVLFCFPFLMWGFIRFEELRLDGARFEWQKGEDLYRRDHPPVAAETPLPDKTPEDRGAELAQLIGKAVETGTTRPPPGEGHPVADAVAGVVKLLSQLGSVPAQTLKDVTDTLKTKVLDKGLDLAADAGKHIIDKLFEPELPQTSSSPAAPVQIFNSCCCQTQKPIADGGSRGPEKGSTGPAHNQKPHKQKTVCRK